MELSAFSHGPLFRDCLPFRFLRAVDAGHGGFLHCFDRDGTLVDRDKSVWEQGRMSWMLLTLYLEHEHRPEYLTWHEQLREWSCRHFADPEHGEWFGYLRRDGVPTNTLKGSLWKSFFHHPRALWRCHGIAKEAGL